jgi:hypothetical protein
MMAATYYVWKWADNDLPGQPADIVAQLCAGKLPPALQPFDPEKALGILAEVADQRRTEMSELLIEAEEQPTGQASFIHLCDPASDSPWLADKLLWAVWPDDLTLYSETSNRLLGLPKRNVVELPDGGQLVDIAPGDLPELLHTLDHGAHLDALACYDRHGNMFQVFSHRHRYAVEWQVMPERDFNRHQIWVAGKPVASQRHTRLGASDSWLDLFDNEVLGMADAQRLWVMFLSSAARPETYSWRDITQELTKPGHATRYRHQQKEDQPPL